MRNSWTHLFFALISIPIVGCTPSQSTHIKEAEAICALYSPQNLHAAASGNGALTTSEYVNNQLRETMKTQEMKAIFAKLTQESHADVYNVMQTEISALIGTTWTCEDAKNFYAINWQPVEAAQEGELIIEVTVVEGQYYQIDNTEYPMANTEDLKVVLDTLSDGQAYTVRLSVPAGTSDAARSQYLEPLRKLGVKKLSLVEEK